MEVKVKCILTNGYFDMDLNRKVKFGEEFRVTEERANFLKEHKAVEIIEKPKVEVKLNNEIKLDSKQIAKELKEKTTKKKKTSKK